MSPFFEASIKPRFSETDMRGHINNTVIPVWLADGRAALFREELGSRVPTMVVNLNVDFTGEPQCSSRLKSTFRSCGRTTSAACRPAPPSSPWMARRVNRYAFLMRSGHCCSPI